MTSSRTMPSRPNPQLSTSTWAKLGLRTAIVSMIAVLAVQAVALSLWPEIAGFAPLNSYPRSALFVVIPVMLATLLLARLGQRQARAVQRFMLISAVVLLLSFIPDYVLPLPGKTLLASSVAAFLHIVAAFTTVGMLVRGYQRHTHYLD